MEISLPLRSGPAPAELAPQARLGLYPKPSDGRFVLQLPQHSEGEVEARISSAAGQRLRQLRLVPRTVSSMVLWGSLIFASSRREEGAMRGISTDEQRRGSGNKAATAR